MGQYMPLLFIMGFLAAALTPVIVVVNLMARARRKRIRGPWTALAEKLGGQFREGASLTGSSILAKRPDHVVSVRMSVVSVMDAVRTPYYPDGGTFTEVMVHLEPGHPPFVPEGTKTQTFKNHMTVPSLANLGRHAEIFVDPGIARVVLPGACDNFQYLDAAVDSLETLAQHVAAAGPLAPGA